MFLASQYPKVERERENNKNYIGPIVDPKKLWSVQTRRLSNRRAVLTVDSIKLDGEHEGVPATGSNYFLCFNLFHMKVH